jgi:hypothetical protein
MIDGTDVPMIFAIMGTLVPKGSYSILYSLCLVLKIVGDPWRRGLSDRKLVLNPSYTGEAEAFWRSVTFPADELARFTAAIPVGGFRWFRAPNVTPIEK